jgi:hypothetical protein
MSDKFKKVRPFDWVASRQHKDRDLQACDLFDQMLALVCAEFHGAAVRLGGCATVHTGEVACLGHFPYGDEWSFVEVCRVDLRVHEPMRQPETGRCSDQSPRLLEFPSDC